MRRPVRTGRRQGRWRRPSAELSWSWAGSRRRALIRCKNWAFRGGGASLPYRDSARSVASALHVGVRTPYLAEEHNRRGACGGRLCFWRCSWRGLGGPGAQRRPDAGGLRVSPSREALRVHVAAPTAVDGLYGRRADREANGKTVVLLHGKNFCGATWEARSRLSRRRVSRRGAGSDRLLQVVEARGLPDEPASARRQHAGAAHPSASRSPIIVGHSMGGMLAMRYALSFPTDLARSCSSIRSVSRTGAPRDSASYSGMRSSALGGGLRVPSAARPCRQTRSAKPGGRARRAGPSFFP